MERPLILITNDDGYDAAGILALRDALDAFADTVIVAPERQQSAGGHAITLHKPVRLRELAPGHYWCSGTPTDCVYIGLHYVLDRKPALVISGINDGLNIADDITYSGTVAGAMEGLLMDVRAVAFSQDHRGTPNIVAAAAQAAMVTRWILDNEAALPKEVLLNVNFPADVTLSTPWRLTRQGVRDYDRQVDEKHDPRGRPYYWIGGQYLGHCEESGADGTAVSDGFVSICPLHLRLTSDAGMKAIEAIGIAPHQREVTLTKEESP